jgi:hypothetical protein
MQRRRVVRGADTQDGRETSGGTMPASKVGGQKKFRPHRPHLESYTPKEVKSFFLRIALIGGGSAFDCIHLRHPRCDILPLCGLRPAAPSPGRSLRSCLVALLWREETRGKTSQKGIPELDAPTPKPPAASPPWLFLPPIAWLTAGRFLYRAAVFQLHPPRSQKTTLCLSLSTRRDWDARSTPDMKS